MANWIEAAVPTRRTSRRAWLIFLSLYALAAAGDFALHIFADHQADEPLVSFASVAVAFAGSLFWPLDLIARLLLAG